MLEERFNDCQIVTGKANRWQAETWQAETWQAETWQAENANVAVKSDQNATISLFFSENPQVQLPLCRDDLRQRTTLVVLIGAIVALKR